MTKRLSDTHTHKPYPPSRVLPYHFDTSHACKRRHAFVWCLIVEKIDSNFGRSAYMFLLSFSVSQPIYRHLADSSSLWMIQWDRKIYLKLFFSNDALVRSDTFTCDTCLFVYSAVFYFLPLYMQFNKNNCHVAINESILFHCRPPTPLRIPHLQFSHTHTNQTKLISSIFHPNPFELVYLENWKNCV